MFDAIGFYKLRLRGKKKRAPKIIPAAFIQGKALPTASKPAIPQASQVGTKVTASIVKESKPVYSKPSTATQKIDKPKSSVVSSFGFSISNTKITEDKNTKEEGNTDVERIVSGAPKTPFTLEQLIEQWNAYATTLVKPSERAALSILNSIKPSIVSGELLEIELHSKTQEAEFDKTKPLLIPFLRQKLNNHHISIRIIINKDSTNITPYTAEEKYNFMAKKNEALTILKNALNLELGH